MLNFLFYFIFPWQRITVLKGLILMPWNQNFVTDLETDKYFAQGIKSCFESDNSLSIKTLEILRKEDQSSLAFMFFS